MILWERFNSERFQNLNQVRKRKNNGTTRGSQASTRPASLERGKIMTRFLSVHLRKLTVIVIFVFTLGAATIAQQPTPRVQPTSVSALPEAFTPQERAKIVSQVLALPQ